MEYQSEVPGVSALTGELDSRLDRIGTRWVVLYFERDFSRDIANFESESDFNGECEISFMLCGAASNERCLCRRYFGGKVPCGGACLRGFIMRSLLAIAFVGAVALAANSSADAMGGCGPGWHPGPYGHHCFRNGGGGGPDVAIVAPGIGVFVAGHGYWDGHRYWMHRDRWHGGWRYR